MYVFYKIYYIQRAPSQQTTNIYHHATRAARLPMPRKCSSKGAGGKSRASSGRSHQSSSTHTSGKKHPGQSTKRYSNPSSAGNQGKKSVSYARGKSTGKSTQRPKPSSNNKEHSASSPAYCYSLNLKNGKKYVGYTTNLNQRLSSHFSGNGAKATQKHTPVSINHVQRCKNATTAKKAEQIVYKNMSKYHGTGNVRGAGHTNSHNF